MSVYVNKIDKITSCVGIILMCVFNDDGLLVKHVVRKQIVPRFHARKTLVFIKFCSLSSFPGYDTELTISS